MGSYGFGFTLNEGVIVEAAKSDNGKIFFNNKVIDLPTVKKVIQALTKEKVIIHIQTSLPLAAGFGLSGASALAAAYALNKLLGLKKSKKDLAVIAHIAEVESGTGLGDVVNQFYGGLLVKFKPSSHFIVKRISLDKIPVYCRYFSKLLTKSIITDPKIKDRINRSATIVLNKMKQLLASGKKPSFSDIIGLSKEFVIHSGLLSHKKTIETIKNIEDNHGRASMIMLGNAVFSDRPFTGARKFYICGKGARIL